MDNIFVVNHGVVVSPCSDFASVEHGMDKLVFIYTGSQYHSLHQQYLSHNKMYD